MSIIWWCNSFKFVPRVSNGYCGGANTLMAACFGVLNRIRKRIHVLIRPAFHSCSRYNFLGTDRKWILLLHIDSGYAPVPATGVYQQQIHCYTEGFLFLYNWLKQLNKFYPSNRISVQGHCAAIPSKVHNAQNLFFKWIFQNVT